MIGVRYRTTDFETYRESDDARIRWVTSTWLAALPTAGSRAAHDKELQRFLAWCTSQQVRALATTPSQADEYLAATGGDRVAPSTLERRRARLRSFFRAAVGAGAARTNPFGG